MKKKIRLLAVVFVVALACGYALLSLARAPKEIACGLGPPPGSKEFAAFEARQQAEVQQTGYEIVCDGNLARYDIRSKLRPFAVVVSKLDFQPVDLTATPFNYFSILGAVAESVSGIKSRLYRSFKMPDGHTVTLFEHDMSADGVHSYRNPKDEPERVNDSPARLIVLQTPGGKAVSVISWNEGRRMYELWLDANVILKGKKQQFIAFAASIPKSNPARKDEPPYTPVSIGDDGTPVFPEPPEYIK
ncbi:hypothetical protein [Duganella sp. BuS-21]|uniref:hypothetical protein n=1 Tax=Duganella sp. BuS-21 TaxID=2943848 RepID=UPI0035A600F3